MFAPRFYPSDYFAPRYFPNVGADIVDLPYIPLTCTVTVGPAVRVGVFRSLGPRVAVQVLRPQATVSLTDDE